MKFEMYQRLPLLSAQEILTERTAVLLLKERYKDWVSKLIKNSNLKRVYSDADNFVQVHHATNTSLLPLILEQGIQPRSITGQFNWKQNRESDEVSPLEHVVYVTNKLHYFFASEYASEPITNEKGTFPCYITLEIPSSALIPDEDAFDLIPFRQRYADFHEGQLPSFSITGKDTLDYYFTSGVLFGIPSSFIKSVTILGDLNFLSKQVASPYSRYRQQCIEWKIGQVVESFNLSNTIKKETKSHRNCTVHIHRETKTDYQSSLSAINQFIEKLSAIKKNSLIKSSGL